MSSVNARVPPSRIAAIDSPADGEVAAYQASSGQFEWVANGSGGGGSVTSVALTESGSALSISGSPITGAGTFNISGAGSSSQVILGDLSLGTLTSGTVTSVGTSQAFITITSPTTTPSISIGNASASATGVLTATDWNTFNNKGSGSVTSVALTESGSALSISGSPITGSGTFNISGAGSSSQVILGDLSLGTLTSGTVTSVALTESGSALSISGSPITGSGTFNISGAGSSSQVILGDLSLGTLTSGTVTGTGSANQVSYWTAASVQAGSTGLTYDPSTGDLTVGGYVETGTKVTTPSGTNLELTTGSASSGSIVIADGANGQISITPNGTGTIKLDGVELDNSAIATGYVLKATSATAAGWAAESGGGGSPGGSDTQIQYNNGGSFGGIGILTYDDTASAEKIVLEASSSEPLMRITQTGAGDGILIEDSANPDSTPFRVQSNGNVTIGINAGTSAKLYVSGNTYSDTHQAGNGSASSPSFYTFPNTGLFFPTDNEAAFSVGGSEKFRVTSNAEIGLEGANYGTSGQVLTSNGSGSAASWTTPSGGSSIWNQVNTKNNINSSYRRFLVSKSAPWGSYSTGSSTTGSVDTPHCRPFIAPVSGDVTEIGINVTTADATATTKLSIGIYSDSNGAPDSLLTLAVMNSTSTGSSFQTSFSGTAALTAGTQYWYVWVRNNSTNSIGFSAESNSGLVWVGASSTVSAGMNQQSVLSLSSSNNTLPGTITQSNLSPTFYGAIKLGLKIA